MKILVVQDHLRSGGTERQSVLLANAFAAAQHDTTLLTFRPGGLLADSVSAAVRRVALQPFDCGADWFAPRLLATAARLRPDVVLCMGRMANCYAGALQAKLARHSPGTVVIATMRTGKTLPWLFRRSLRRVAHVVANSREARVVLAQQHGVPAENISVIYNSLVFAATPDRMAVAARITNPDANPPIEGRDGSPSRPRSANQPNDHSAITVRESLRAPFGASAGTLVLLCVAMFRPEKNQRELIEIAAGLPADFDWQLWLAGEGPARAGCEALARAKGLAERVKFLGLVRDPSPLYAAADVAVHASWSESLSNFLIEAQANGLLAVAYEAQGIAECFLPERTGWVIPRGDRARFRAAIERLGGTAATERDARAGAARQFARSTFDPSSQVSAYLALFDRLR